MAVFSPVITNGVPPLQVTMIGSITYAEFVYMMGVLNLQARKIFLESQSGQQIDSNMQYVRYDSSGVSNQDILKPRRDPYQKQNSLYFTAKGNAPIVFNGLSYLSFNVLPRQMLSMSFCMDQTDPGSLSPGRNLDNFSKARTPLDNLKLYDRMKDCQ